MNDFEWLFENGRLTIKPELFVRRMERSEGTASRIFRHVVNSVTLRHRPESYELGQTTSIESVDQASKDVKPKLKQKFLFEL